MNTAITNANASDLKELQFLYADLIIQFGLNLQPKQSLRITSEISLHEFTRLIVESENINCGYNILSLEESINAVCIQSD